MLLYMMEIDETVCMCVNILTRINGLSINGFLKCILKGCKTETCDTQTPSDILCSLPGQQKCHSEERQIR